MGYIFSFEQPTLPESSSYALIGAEMRVMVEVMREVGTAALELQRDGYVISTDPARLDLDVVHGELSRSYWAAGRPRAALPARHPRRPRTLPQARRRAVLRPRALDGPRGRPGSDEITVMTSRITQRMRQP